MTEAAILSPKALKAFLDADPAGRVRSERAREEYDLLSFGGGSCPKVVGRHATRFGWKKLCFITNGSDNGGSTQKIVEALRPEYGPTLPVGDITSSLISLLGPLQYGLLNLRGWKLDPDRFSEDERRRFTSAVDSLPSFADRVALAIKWYADKSAGTETDPESWRSFCAELLELARLVEEAGLIRSGVKGLEIAEASVRHHAFNAMMIRTGAYDARRRTTDPERFAVGLYLLQRALSIEHPAFPCSLDEQALYAEWVDEDGGVIWSTKMTAPERPVTGIGGQVSLSNAPDSVKVLKGNGYARYGRFGFDPDLPAPRAYPEAVEAIRRLRPGSPVLFGPSSFVVSTSPCLAVPEIADEIEKRSDCPRILVLNLTRNNETVGWGPRDFLDFWELNTRRPVAKTIDYVVVNNDLASTPEIAEALTDKGDTFETFKFRGPVRLVEEERAVIPRRGVNLVEAPLAAVGRELMRLSSTADREFVWVPNHHSQRLMALCRLLVEDYKERQSRTSRRVSRAPATSTRKLPLDDSGETESLLHYAPPA